MSEVDQKLWGSILRSKQVLASAGEFWNLMRWVVLGTQLVFAVWSAATGLGWGDALKFIVYANIVMVLNHLIKFALSKRELSIAKTEAEFAYRLDYADFAGTLNKGRQF
jgi:hypothetical protein